MSIPYPYKYKFFFYLIFYMYSFKVGGIAVGGDSPCFIIAEAGVNHNGDIAAAKRLVDEAKKSGADAIKFQSFNSEELATPSLEKAEYQEDASSESQLDMLKKLELSEIEFFELKQYCSEKGIVFLSTPFDFSSAEMLERCGVPAYKISSGDLNNYPFILFIAKKGKPLIISTGMGNWDEISKAVEVVFSTGNKNIALLQCTTSYPAAFEEINLNVLPAMRS